MGEEWGGYLEVRREADVHLLLPIARDLRQYIRLWHVADALLVVVLWVVREHHALHLILRLPEPALLDVVQDRLDPRLRTGRVALIADRDTQPAAQQAAKVGGGVRELVLLVVALVQGDEDAEVVLAGRDLDGRAGELGGELVEAARRDALGGALDVEGRDGGVMRRLLGEVGDADRLVDLGQGGYGCDGARSVVRGGGLGRGA